jgi:hypothetical protein
VILETNHRYFSVLRENKQGVTNLVDMNLLTPPPKKSQNQILAQKVVNQIYFLTHQKINLTKNKIPFFAKTFFFTKNNFGQKQFFLAQ